MCPLSAENEREPQRAPYRDSSLPVEQRVEDLLGRMTLEEKAGQLGSLMPFDWDFYMSHTPQQRAERVKATTEAEWIDTGVGQLTVVLRELTPAEAAEKNNQLMRYAQEHTRLGIPPIIHDEGLHGLLMNDATVFPQSIAMASAWDPEIIYKTAQVIGKEARARGVRQLLSPTINIARDTRSGRTQETYGEDPYLTSRLVVPYVKGMQEQGVAATPKHFAANFVGDGGRDSNAIHISERLLREIYLPAFEAAIVEAGAMSLMAAYNSLDGIPCSCNRWLLTDLLRGEWGFQGFVVSDYDSVIHILTKHAAATDRTDVARRALEAGMDVEFPFTQCFGEDLVAGIRQGKIDPAALDEAVRRVLRAKFQLGLFEDPFVDPIQAEAANHTAQHQALALEAARMGIVLLKNDNKTLPLRREVSKVAVIGPLADAPSLGDYTWDGFAKERSITPRQGIEALGVEVRYAQGCPLKEQSTEGFAEAVEAARQSQVAVICVGNDRTTEGEFKDRSNLELPGSQAELIKAVAATGTPVVVVLLSGSVVIMTDWIDQVGAVVEAWYPGEKGGQAIAEVLFGDTNPSGKLPVTFPRSMGQFPLYYNFKPSGRDLHYADQAATPLFAFGHGLSYTSFEYSNLQISPEQAGADATFTITLDVRNSGERAGAEVVQLYIHDVVSTYTRPVKELKGFRRVALAASETKTVRFELPAAQLSYIGENMRRVVEPGAFEVQVGSASDDIRLAGCLTVA